MSYLSKNLIFLRSREKISQSQIGEKLDIKRNTWSNWENGISKPDLDEVIRIADHFGVKVDDLLRKDLGNAKKLVNEVPSLLELHKRLKSVEQRLSELESRK